MIKAMQICDFCIQSQPLSIEKMVTYFYLQLVQFKFMIGLYDII